LHLPCLEQMGLLDGRQLRRQERQLHHVASAPSVAAAAPVSVGSATEEFAGMSVIVASGGSGAYGHTTPSSRRRVPPTAQLGTWVKRGASDAQRVLVPIDDAGHHETKRRR
jgi:hypothetical protein